MTTPQELGKALKTMFKVKYGLKISTRYIKTVRGLMGSWYEVSVWESKQTFSNELRAEIIKRFLPDANILNWNDVSYGNIRPQTITLYGLQWVEFLNQEQHQEDLNHVTNILKKVLTDKGESF